VTLFDKYGGVPTIRLIVKAFYKQVLSRPNLRRYFEGVDMDRLIEHQVEFIAFALGKPKTHYPDSSLKEGHRGLGITSTSYDEAVGILHGILSNFQVEHDDINTILGVLYSKRHLIVERKV
jgi:hemoglobin